MPSRWGEQLTPDVSQELLDSEVPSLTVETALGQPPSDEELYTALHSLRAPGPDQVTALMLRSAGPRARWQTRLLVHRLWLTPPNAWESVVKEVLGTPLYKGSGDRRDLDTYRFIMLINVISRLLGRIVSSRIQTWAESRNLFGDRQWGFRRNRSVVDVLLLLRTLVELAAAVCASCASVDGSHYDHLLLIMFEAFSKIQRGPAQLAFRKLGMPAEMLTIISGLHDFSTYRMRTPGGDSDTFHMPLGFREGCCSSPSLYNLWHCMAMNHYRRLEEQTLSSVELRSMAWRANLFTSR